MNIKNLKMRLIALVGAFVLSFALFAANTTAFIGALGSEYPGESGFKVLFNGKDTTGWTGGVAMYGIDAKEAGVLQCYPKRKRKGMRGDLTTKDSYRNFILRFDYQLPPNGNNGLGIRMQPGRDAAYWGMCELQLLDDEGSSYYNLKKKADKLKPYQYTGSVYGVVPCRRDNKARISGTYTKPANQWNSEEVKVIGSEIEVRLNGVLITKADVSKYSGWGDTPDRRQHPGLHRASGPIGWLGHGCKVKFRNIRIKVLPDDATMDEYPGAVVKPENVGVCSWSYHLPIRKVAEEMKKSGVKGVHLALGPFIAPDKRHGAAEGEEGLRFVKEQVAKGEWKIMSTMVSFPQEDYSTLKSIRVTGGIVPDKYWKANQEIISKGAKLTKELGVKYMSCHAGFLDEKDKKAFKKFVERVKWMRDECAKHGVVLILESGQETAQELVTFMKAVPGIGINFDPANMILYGKGNPLEAVKMLAPWIKQVHVKDAVETEKRGTWGTEVPWGNGSVGAKRFIAALKSVGYKGDYVVEREGGNDRPGDIALAIKRLTK